VPDGSGRVDYRLPGIELTARLVPLALPGREREVAAAIGHALAHATPTPHALRFEGASLDVWGAALRGGWPRTLRPLLWRTHADGSPFVSLREDSFDAWLDGKSKNFRGQMRRLRRRFAAAGGSSRLATHASLAADAATFVRLHAARWAGRRRTNLAELGERFAALIVDAGAQLLDERRLALRVLELDGEPICAQLFIAAGGTVLFVNGGWDERHADLRPSLVCLLDAVEDAFAQGCERLDLGVGAQPYKRRFADGEDALTWALLLCPGAHLPASVARSAPALLRARLRGAALHRLPDEQIARLKRLTARVRGAST
jgi:CelD/BcsL family acetyltransferase involved in cellulose biosynthesis